MKEKFKSFVKANPRLINYVKDNNVSWQNLYEIYSLYGEDPNIWNKYLNSKSSLIDDLLNIIKGVNLENVRKTTEGIQKVISIIQGLDESKPMEEYQKKEEYIDIDD
ncbi:MAG: hypothetical protein IKO78_01845 [Bacilli bacterium]|nr:hypothetical protein [Bacilli bacterium]